jgi:hypothetical protein
VQRLLVAPDDALADLVPRLPRLTEGECFVGVGSTQVWSIAAGCRAPVLVLVGTNRGAWVHNLVTIGLLHITAGRGDFLARLLSREPERRELDTLPFAQSDFDRKLLRDTVHHVSRAIAAHLQRELLEEERAAILELLYRHAHGGLALGATGGTCARTLHDDLMTLSAAQTPVHFLRDDAAFTHLAQLVRQSAVELRFADLHSPLLVRSLTRAWKKKACRLALLQLDADVPLARHWAHAPLAPAAQVIHGGALAPLSSVLGERQESRVVPGWPSDGARDWGAWSERLLTAPIEEAEAEADAIASSLGLL